jgi:hypothetical protein
MMRKKHNEYIFTFDDLTENQIKNISEIKSIDIMNYLYNTFITEDVNNTEDDDITGLCSFLAKTNI